MSKCIPSTIIKKKNRSEKKKNKNMATMSKFQPESRRKKRQICIRKSKCLPRYPVDVCLGLISQDDTIWTF
jgi:hypothetical protein